MNKLKQLLLWTAGCDLELIAKHQTDQNKYIGIGGTIIFTSIMAGMSSGYAFNSIFYNTTTSVFFGVFWALLIYNLDRFIVSSTGVSDGTARITKSEILNALPRIILACVIGIVIAFPLELRVFEKEINAEIRSQTDINHDNVAINIENKFMIIDYYFEEIESLKTDQSDSPEFNTQIAQRIVELYGLMNEKLTLKEEELMRYKYFDERNSGLLSRYLALNKLTTENPSALWIRWFIICLILLIEITPILFKLMTVDGPYEAELEMNNKRKIMELNT